MGQLSGPWFVNVTMDTLCSARASRWAIAALKEVRDETGEEP